MDPAESAGSLSIGRLGGEPEAHALTEFGAIAGRSGEIGGPTVEARRETESSTGRGDRRKALGLSGMRLRDHASIRSRIATGRIVAPPRYSARLGRTAGRGIAARAATRSRSLRPIGRSANPDARRLLSGRRPPVSAIRAAVDSIRPEREERFSARDLGRRINTARMP